MPVQQLNINGIYFPQLAQSKSDLGLANVDNTADASKPVSTAQNTADLLEKKTRRAIADAASTLAVTDFILAYTSISAARAVTLPTAASASGQHFEIKDESGSATSSFKITAVGTIDGAVNPDLVVAAYGVKRIYSNGTAWFSE